LIHGQRLIPCRALLYERYRVPMWKSVHISASREPFAAKRSKAKVRQSSIISRKTPYAWVWQLPPQQLASFHHLVKSRCMILFRI